MLFNLNEKFFSQIIVLMSYSVYANV